MLSPSYCGIIVKVSISVFEDKEEMSKEHLEKLVSRIWLLTSVRWEYVIIIKHNGFLIWAKNYEANIVLTF